MFRNDDQISQVAQILLKAARLERLWTDKGPTPEAIRLMDQRGGPLSHGEAILLLVCFDLWNGHAKVPFSEVINTLDGEHLWRLGGLLIALGSDQSSTVDGWIETWKR